MGSDSGIITVGAIALAFETGNVWTGVAMIVMSVIIVINNQ